MTLEALTEAEGRFDQHLEEVRKKRQVPWYRYQTLGSLSQSAACFRSPRANILNFVAGERILDIGCGDGDNAFFLESLGFAVDAIDFAPTNFNQLAGFRELKEQLGSNVTLLEMDLDENGSALGCGQYGLAMALGVLYHLKNPFAFLEGLSSVAPFCLLSTRISRFTPDRQLQLQDYPIAYLLDSGELNADATNYWIFSDAGLKRLFQRAGWDVLDYATVGDPEADQRAYVLARSRRLRRALSPSKWEGCYAPEGPWRWTAGAFSFEFSPVPLRDTVLSLSFRVTEELLKRYGSTYLTIEMAGESLGGIELNRADSQLFEVTIPAIATGTATIHCRLSKYLRAGEIEARELGMILHSVSLE